MIRKAKDNDARVCAEIFYSADPEILEYLFVSKKNTCITIAEDLFSKPCNIFSKDYCFVEEDDNGDIIGAMWIVEGNKKRATERGFQKYYKDIMKYLPIRKALCVFLRSVIFAKHKDEIDDNEYYITALAVLPAHKNKGVASRLLTKVKEVAIESGFKKVSLLVDIKNECAKKTYLKNGYKTAPQTLTPKRHAKHVLCSFEKMILEIA